MSNTKPEILAPAGGPNSFLAALAAGADAVYLGLKHFSARMQADNFAISELTRMNEMARRHDARLYVAMNTLLKPGDSAAAGRLVERLEKYVKPAALIVQDLGMVELARQAGFSGELHVSTLANLSHPLGLQVAQKLGASRVVIPRELNLDEAKIMADRCPEGMELELFVHGALCHCVSGRCYWSSYLGGKSGLRGRCVQPCRRRYQPAHTKGGAERFFSCQDLSLDVLVRPVMSIDKITSWKIEGRKKGPHYVYYTVSAYKLLRDHADDPQARKDAEDLLSRSLSRPTTHSIFLPQRPYIPVQPRQESASGKLVSQVKREMPKLEKGKKGKGDKRPPRANLLLIAREELLPGDLLRVGYEDDPFHQTIKIRKRIPKRGRVDFRPQGMAPPSGTNVFLVDRREVELQRLLTELNKEMAGLPRGPERSAAEFTPKNPPRTSERLKAEMHVNRTLPKGKFRPGTAVWLEPRTLRETAKPLYSRVWWWLPPVIWPDDEDKYAALVRDVAGAEPQANFVLNAPWQRELLPDFHDGQIVAGPFCNAANPHTLEQYKQLGFTAAFVAPELSGPEFLELPSVSPLPLGVVLRGAWPLGISRILAEEVRTESTYLSPKKETVWVKKRTGNNWIYPGWELNITAHRRELEKAGYAMFALLYESWPKAVARREKDSEFNWNLDLL